MQNATFWGEDIQLENFYSDGYYMYCTYQVRKVPLFEEKKVQKTNSKLHILGPENARFWGHSCHYSLTQHCIIVTFNSAAGYDKNKKGIEHKDAKS